MKNFKFGFFVFLVGIFLSGNYCYSGEVDRENLADEGTIVESYGITFIPHAELEYGAFDYDTGVNNGNHSDTGLAVGLTAGKGRETFDLYGRFSYADSDNSIINYGVVWAHKFSGGDRRKYFAIALENQELKEAGDGGGYYGRGHEYWESNEVRIKPSVGFTLIKKSAFSLMSGCGGYLGMADVEYGLFDGSNRYYENSEDITTYGLFVQSKAKYDLSEKLALTGSFLWEGGMNSGVDLGDDSLTGFVFLWYLRFGMSYMF